MPVRPRLAATAATALFVVAAFVTAAQAQVPSAPPLEDGDVVWTFGNEDPFFDTRVAGALGTLMAPAIDADAPDGMRIVRVEANGPDFVSGTIYPTNDVPSLLAAAGFDPAAPFTQVGECLYWTSDIESGIPWSTPGSPATDVIRALQDALASFGLARMGCAATPDPAAAHLLFWVHGEAPPALPQRDVPTFLAGTGVPAGPTAPPTGWDSVPGQPGPATTGNAGLQPAEHPYRATFIALGIAAAGALMIGGRLVTRRRAMSQAGTRPSGRPGGVG